uniref:Unannotated protein n=1 Tax=freshwater metagenome TaxID=449393 RepID=A0A6J5Z159_9ZZZZ
MHTGAARESETWLRTAATIPSQVAGATAAAAARLAGSETRLTVPNAAALIGAVPTVAAAVSESGPLTGAGSPRRSSATCSGPERIPIAATAAKLSCQPGSRRIAGLSVRLTVAASSSEYQRALGLDAAEATSAAAPMIAALWIEGPLPASGT